MMFNPSVGVRIFDDVLLKFAAFMPPPTLPLPRETSSSSSSSSSNNSPTISIGIASTKSLTSISGKRIDASSFAFIVVDIVMMSSSSPSFPLSLVSVFLRKAHSAFRSHKIERKNLSLILSLSLIKINQNESFTRNSCYTNTASSALPRLIAFRGSHQHVCVKARESARNFLSCGELILFWGRFFFLLPFFFEREEKERFSSFRGECNQRQHKSTRLTFLVHHHREEAPVTRRTTDNKDNDTNNDEKKFIFESSTWTWKSFHPDRSSS